MSGQGLPHAVRGSSGGAGGASSWRAPTRARARASLFMLSGLLACFFLKEDCAALSRVLEHPYR